VNFVTMSAMQGATTPLTSSLASFVGDRPKARGVTSLVATEFEASRAKNLSAKHSSLNGKAVIDESFRRPSKSSNTARQKRAGTCTVKAVLQDIFTGTKKDTDVLKGNFLLSKTSSLDVINFGDAAVDTALELLDFDITLQLVSVDLDPSTKGPKLSAKSKVKQVPLTDPTASSLSGDQQYTVTFDVPKDFGEVGAFQIWNPNPDKFYLHYMTLALPDKTLIQFPCNSWVFNETNYSKPRVFFSNKTYLPAATPAGLQALRESELITLR
jgi:hypothetical protein